MKCQIVIYFCAILIADAFAKKERIVGGTLVDIQQYPFQASFRVVSQNMHFCGGTIVSKKHIVSSAHCFVDRNGDYRDIRVYTGSSSPLAVVAEYKIGKIDIHPSYTGKLNQNEAFQHDISVTTVRGSIKFNQFTNKAELPTSDVVVGTDATITGYGKVSSQSTTLSMLQRTSMKILALKDCSKSLNRRILKRQGCLTASAGIGGCHGDSGGPVSQSGVFIGIMSFVVPCAQGYPDVFLKVYSYLDFIQPYLDSLR